MASTTQHWKAQKMGLTDLMYCARQADEAAVFRVLMEPDCQPRTLDRHNVSALYRAVFSGCSLGVIKAIWSAQGKQQRFLREVHSLTGNTILHAAAWRGDDTVVQWVLDMTEDIAVNVPNGDGDTALHLAVAEDRTEAARALLQAGADVIAVNSRRQSVRSVARGSKTRALVKKYLDRRKVMEEFTIGMSPKLGKPGSALVAMGRSTIFDFHTLDLIAECLWPVERRTKDRARRRKEREARERKREERQQEKRAELTRRRGLRAALEQCGGAARLFQATQDSESAN